jgi:hypothetical protein
MDSTTLQQAGVSTGLIAILLIVYRALVWLNHRSISSRCCGRTAEVQIDIAGLSGTPVENKTAVESKDATGTCITNTSTSETWHSNPLNSDGTKPGPEGLGIVKDTSSV